MYTRKIMLALATCAIALVLDNSVLAKNMLGSRILAKDGIGASLLLTNTKLGSLDADILRVKHGPGSLAVKLPDVIKVRDSNQLLTLKQLRVRGSGLRDNLVKIHPNNLLQRIGIGHGHLKDRGLIVRNLPVALLDGNAALTNLAGDTL